MHYNPFAYLQSEKDILKLVNTIIVNTKGEGQQSGEDFWVKAKKLYYTALIDYIWYEAPEEEQNFAMLIDMIDASEAREDDENFKNAVDLLFEELEGKDPNHFAVRQYKKYKHIRSKTHSNAHQTVFTKENDKYQWLVLEQKSHCEVEVRQTDSHGTITARDNYELTRNLPKCVDVERLCEGANFQISFNADEINLIYQFGRARQSKGTGKTADSCRGKTAQNPKQRKGGYGTMKLSRYEQETIVNYNAGEQTATLYTRDKAVMRKLDTLVADYPDTYKLIRQDKVSKTYSFPKSYISYLKPRAVSTEQRERARQMMVKRNKAKTD